MTDTNEHLILVGGASATGKSASLRDLENPESVMYLNTESNKKLPFKSKFHEFNIIDPMQVFEAFDVAETEKFDHINTIIIDSLTFLMDQYETQYVLNAANTMKAWGEFQQYFKKMMQQYVAKSSKNVIFLAHTASQLNEADQVLETKVPVKGAIKNNGVESYFSTVISTKKVPLKDLKDYKSDMLTITPEEEALGFKYCFQTKITKNTINERIRSPMGMFDTNETYTDNNIQMIIDRLHSYYK